MREREFILPRSEQQQVTTGFRHLILTNRPISFSTTKAIKQQNKITRLLFYASIIRLSSRQTWTRVVLFVCLFISFPGSDSEPPFSNNLMVSNALSRLIVYWHGVFQQRVSYKSSLIAKTKVKNRKNLTFCWLKLKVLPLSFKININESSPTVSLSSTWIIQSWNQHLV